MNISIYITTFKEILIEDGVICAKIYLNDLVRGGDITQEQYKEILFGEEEEEDNN